MALTEDSETAVSISELVGAAAQHTEPVYNTLGGYLSFFYL